MRRLAIVRLKYYKRWGISDLFLIIHLITSNLIIMQFFSTLTNFVLFLSVSEAASVKPSASQGTNTVLYNVPKVLGPPLVSTPTPTPSSRSGSPTSGVAEKLQNPLKELKQLVLNTMKVSGTKDKRSLGAGEPQGWSSYQCNDGYCQHPCNYRGFCGSTQACSPGRCAYGDQCDSHNNCQAPITCGGVLCDYQCQTQFWGAENCPSPHTCNGVTCNSICNYYTGACQDTQNGSPYTPPYNQPIVVCEVVGIWQIFVPLFTSMDSFNQCATADISCELRVLLDAIINHVYAVVEIIAVECLVLYQEFQKIMSVYIEGVEAIGTQSNSISGGGMLGTSNLAVPAKASQNQVDPAQVKSLQNAVNRQGK